MKVGFAVLFAFGMVVGCSGGAGMTSSSSGGTAGSSSALCQGLCDWRTRCAKADTNCQAECANDLSRSEGKLSGAYTNAVATCFQGLACTENDDGCIADFGRADPAHPDVPEVKACLDRRTECSQGTPEGDSGTVTQPTTAFSDDYCLSITALTAAARAEANACLTQPCAGVRDCLIRAGAFNY